jgi:cysteine-rich repeat protein
VEVALRHIRLFAMITTSLMVTCGAKTSSDGVGEFATGGFRGPDAAQGGAGKSPTGGTSAATSEGGAGACNGRPCYTVVVAAAYCGDGIVQLDSGEQCDDGNRIGGDGCSGICQIEHNWNCPKAGQPCISIIVCGNGTRQTGESCDDGNTADNDGCSSLCSVEIGWYCPPSDASNLTSTSACKKLVSCGDGIVQTQYGETCDLGGQNGIAGSGCSTTCGILAGCGDGIVKPPETCDDGQNDGSYGGCTPDCQHAPYCGDDVKNGPEQCDCGTDNVPMDNAPYGSCVANCTLGPHCGDGLVQIPPEQCDLGVSNGPNSLCNNLCILQILD